MIDYRTAWIYTGFMNSMNIPLFNCKVICGFPSPADDHLDLSLDLNQHLIKHPAATFFVRAQGESMLEAGILNNDLLIVDRALPPKHNDIVIAVINNEFTVKRLKVINKQVFLYPANKNYKPIAISNLEEVQIWGVVTYAIHDLCSS